MTEKFTPGEWLIQGTTVYALNDRGHNRFDARVQYGFTDEHQRTSDDELVANALLMKSAPLMHTALKLALPIVGATLSDLKNQGFATMGEIAFVQKIYDDAEAAIKAGGG